MRLNRKFWGFFIAAFGFVAGGAWIINTTGQNPLAILLDRQALTQFFAEAGKGSVGFFILAHVVANAVGVPGTLLVVVGGAVYGLWWGTMWSVVGATLGAIAAFLLARYLLYGWFQARFHHRPMFQKLNDTLCDQGLGCVLVIRFSPISPFNVVNFALGLTPVHLRFYALGTFIGIVPGTLAYTWLGVTGADALSGGSLLPLVCCLIMLMALSALPIWMQKRS